MWTRYVSNYRFTGDENEALVFILARFVKWLGTEQGKEWVELEDWERFDPCWDEGIEVDDSLVPGDKVLKIRYVCRPIDVEKGLKEMFEHITKEGQADADL